MKCPNCNATIADDSKFCTVCGAQIASADIKTAETQPQAGAQSQAAGAQPQTAGAQPQAGPQPQAGGPQPQASYGAGYQQGQPYAQPVQRQTLNSRQRTGLIAIIAAAACICLLVIILIATHKKTINLADYTEVEFSGYDGYGTAYIEFDYEEFYEDVQSSMNSKGKKAFSGSSNWKDLLNDLGSAVSSLGVYDGLEYELDKTSGLSNGDKVTVSYKFNNDAAKKYGIKYKGDDQKFKVEGLEEIKEVDPFAYIEVSFSGTAPDVYVDIEKVAKDEVSDVLYFNVEPSGGISKGDTVTVSVDADEEYMMSEYGIKLTALTKEYTCEAVDAYIMDGGELGDEVLGQMKSQTEDTVNAYFAQETAYISLADLKYVGYYFLSAKNSSAWEHNEVYVVYSGTVSSLEQGGFAPTTVYFPVKFSNVIKYADGTDYVELDSTDIYGDTSLEYDYWDEVDGYDNENTMKNELVTSQKGEYNVASFGDLQ